MRTDLIQRLRQIVGENDLGGRDRKNENLPKRPEKIEANQRLVSHRLHVNEAISNFVAEDDLRWTKGYRVNSPVGINPVSMIAVSGTERAGVWTVMLTTGAPSTNEPRIAAMRNTPEAIRSARSDPEQMKWALSACRPRLTGRLFSRGRYEDVFRRNVDDRELTTHARFQLRPMTLVDLLAGFDDRALV
jgi:hypothetical protein